MMRTKRYTLLWLAAAMAAVALPGCKESDPGATWNPGLTARYLNLKTDALSFGASSQLEQSLEVTAVTTPWQFAGVPDWLSFSPATGSATATVKATATENTSGENSRTCLLTFESAVSDYDYKVTMSATQTYAEAYIAPSKKDVAFSGSASTETVTVQSNISWQASSDRDWLTVKADASSVTLTATENTTNAARTATVTLKGKTVTVITVIQAVAKIEGDKSTLTYQQVGGTYQLSVRSEASWTATTEQAWIQIDPMQGGAGTTSVLVSATPNATDSERRGIVTFFIGGTKQIEVAVVQKGQYLETDLSELAFKAGGETLPLQVLSNVTWTLQTKPDWVTVSESGGTGDRAVQVTAEDNPELFGRSGNLVFGIPGGTITATVAVSQAAKQFDPEAFSILHFSDKAGTDTLRFATDAAWTATCNENWITIAPTQGRDDGRIAVTVTENTGDDRRTGTISVQVGTTIRTAAVEQDGKFFTVTAGGQATIPSTGGSQTVTFMTNDTWKVQTGTSWITADPSEGSGDGSVSLTAGDHPSINTRTDTSCIQPVNLQGIRIITTQAARYLRVDHTALSFFAKGGTSETVVVETDASYTITTQQTWLSISQQGNTFTVSAQPYTGKTKREGTVSLAMTGLRQGESYRIDMPVVQYAEGAFFTVIPFKEDDNWSLAGGTGAEVSVTGYGSDENWNLAGKTTLTVVIEGYDGEDNWNLCGGESVEAGHEGFGENENWSLGGDETVEVGHEDFDDNENWNL